MDLESYVQIRAAFGIIGALVFAAGGAIGSLQYPQNYLPGIPIWATELIIAMGIVLLVLCMAGWDTKMNMKGA